jgi:hypothetical protein
VVHPAVGHLRPLLSVTREPISACLTVTIADDLPTARCATCNAIGERPIRARNGPFSNMAF